MKRKIILILLAGAMALLGGCTYIENLELPSFLQFLQNSEESQDYNDQQQSALDDLKEGAGSVFDLIKDKLFSLDELTDLGILDKEKPLESLGELIDNDKSFSMSDIDMDSLNLEHLSGEQISMLLKVFSGEMTMTELITSGTFTLDDLQKMGLFKVIVDNINNSDD